MASAIHTYTGRSVSLSLFAGSFEPHIPDIAGALSQINRWGGHTRYPYSVGQHCLLVEWLVRLESPQVRLQALLHDAEEAYLNDLPSPLKACWWMLPYRILGDRMRARVFRCAGIPRKMHWQVEAADVLAATIEAYCLLPVIPDWVNLDQGVRLANELIEKNMSQALLGRMSASMAEEHWTDKYLELTELVARG